MSKSNTSNSRHAMVPAAQMRVLEAQIDESIRRSVEKKYYPTGFIAMRQRHGTVNAMVRAVRGDGYGYDKAVEMGLKSHSLEQVMVNNALLFSRFPTALAMAFARLKGWRKR
jgi:hypothetical protein